MRDIDTKPSRTLRTLLMYIKSHDKGHVTMGLTSSSVTLRPVQGVIIDL